ncbi:MAG: hypothetical protein AAF560_27320, partial [Acidobacteriota bacterium]
DARPAPARSPAAASAALGSPASSGSWKTLGPYGGSVKAVAVSPLDPNLVLAGTFAQGGEYGGLFRSTDGGDTWTHASVPANTQITKISFAADGVAFALQDFADLWRSTNGGQDWTALGVADSVDGFVVAPSNPLLLWARISDNVAPLLRSEDGGTTWDEIASPVPVDSLCTLMTMDPVDTNVIAMACEFPRQLWISTDGGMSWNERSAGLPNAQALAMVQDGAQILVGSSSGLYASGNLGMSWIELNNGWSGTVRSLAIQPDDPDVIYAGLSTSGVHRSINGGVSWQTTLPGTFQRTVDAIHISPHDNSNVLLGTLSFGVLQSQDGGGSFPASNTGLTSLKTTSVAVNPQDASQLAASFRSLNGGGVYRSTDGGASWTLDEAFPSGRVTHVAYSPQGVLHAVHDGPTSVAQEGAYRRNGDGTWTYLGPDQGTFFETQLTSLRFSEHDPDLIMATGSDFGGEATLWRSDTAGMSWSKVYEGTEPRERVVELEILGDGEPTEMVAVFETPFSGQPGGVLRSVNGGVSWFPSNTGLPADFNGRSLCRIAGQPNHLLAATNDALVPPQTGSLHLSTDGGASWAPTGFAGPVARLLCSPGDPSVVYATFGTGAVVRRSSDQGVSFAPYDLGLEVAGPSQISSDDGMRMAHSRSGPARLFLSSSTGVYLSELVPELFADGFESGDTNAWSSSRSTSSP